MGGNIIVCTCHSGTRMDRVVIAIKIANEKKYQRYLNKEKTGESCKDITKNARPNHPSSRPSAWNSFIIELLHDQMQKQIDVHPHLPIEEVHEL